MNRVLKTAILTTAAVGMTLAALPAANARDWHHRGGGWHHSYHSHGSGDAVAAGVLGLAAGAIIGGALTSRPDYYEPDYVVRRPYPGPARRYYPVGRVAYEGAVEPWTPEWYSYCSDRYRTFNARSGTFTGYDGQQHFCAAN